MSSDFKPWFEKIFPGYTRSQFVEKMFPGPTWSQFIVAYYEYVNSLDPNQAEIQVSIAGSSALTRPQLLGHIEKRDEIGEKWTEIILEGIFGRHSPEEQERILRSPWELTQKAIEEFQLAASHRGKPQAD